LLPFQPALLHLAEHVAADRAVGRAVDAVVLLFLHREVGPQDLLQRVLLLSLLERVVSSVLGDRLVVLGFPGQLLDFLMGLGHALATHSHPFLSGRRRQGPAALVSPPAQPLTGPASARTTARPKLLLWHHNPIWRPVGSQHETGPPVLTARPAPS